MRSSHALRLPTPAILILALLALAIAPLGRLAPAEAQTELIRETVAELGLRGIGPALMGGRIADVEVDPRDDSVWWLAVGSGGVWRTDNAGVTWTAVFEDQSVYSVGDIALDPSDPDVVWVGTGENVSGRHVGWGDGVYRSRNGGTSWENMGLTRSEHIGKILVDPRDGRVVLVAAEGPLWTAGGERGVYRTTDGGETWEHVLSIDEDTGVTDLEFSPDDADVIYAAAYDRRRKIWGHLAGGPGSGLYKSTDGGVTWRRLESGLPRGDMGKIGLAVTPANPDAVFATIEAGDEERGFYRSLDRGESWERRNSYISGGTGPHYYQEIEVSPHDADLIYQMDVFLHVTRDGGATFDYLETGAEKHSDNHAMWIDPEDGEHILVGTDAGLYESFDEGRTFRHFPNLPISQFYKLALDTDAPFYNILGGAQDLGTLWGPSRTMNVEGVRNRDWFVPMGADGYAVQIDPTDSDILYLQTQQGNLYRYDRGTDEALDIQAQPAPGEPPERWNWDSPVLLSPHDPNRVYHGSQRLWRSNDRGDSWEAISGDLTTNANRYELEFKGRVWSTDDLIDNGAMSKYSTLTSISESPIAAGVIYTGSDDGLVHVTESGGTEWRRAAPLPGVPERAFINDVEASQHDAATVFVVADNHKEGDFRPLIFESRDHGRTWASIAGDLRAEGIAWAIEQDHQNPQLLFLGAEFGLYVSVNGGVNWHALPGPTIPHRDIEIQRQVDDVVGSTFGRGFLVLDDYGPLRQLADGLNMAGGGIFAVRDSWTYNPSIPMQARGKPTLGSDDFTGPNPPFGAVFTYFLEESARTEGDRRREMEREIRGRGGDVPFPGYETLHREASETGPRVLIGVRDAHGQPVRLVRGSASAGVHRVAWDLRRPAPEPVDLSTPGFTPPWMGPRQGPLVAAGEYSAQLMVVDRQGMEELGDPVRFTVRGVGGAGAPAVADFQAQTAALVRAVSGAVEELGNAEDRLRHMRAALLEAPEASATAFQEIDDLGARLHDLRQRMTGDRVRQRLNESTSPSISGRVGRVAGNHWDTWQAPTATQVEGVEIARAAFAEWSAEFTTLMEDGFGRVEELLEQAGAPWAPGRQISGVTGANPASHPRSRSG